MKTDKQFFDPGTFREFVSAMNSEWLLPHRMAYACSEFACSVSSMMDMLDTIGAKDWEGEDASGFHALGMALADCQDLRTALDFSTTPMVLMFIDPKRNLLSRLCSQTCVCLLFNPTTSCCYYVYRINSCFNPSGPLVVAQRECGHLRCVPQQHCYHNMASVCWRAATHGDACVVALR